MNKPYMQIPSDTLNLTGAQQFRVNMNIKSNTASIEQLNELREFGKRFSPAFDTLTNGTSVVLVNT
ncbi:MAG: hypothetical protein WA421_19595 [Nitrososphaeraceae archaeon]